MASLYSRELSLAGIRIDAVEWSGLIGLLGEATSRGETLLCLNHNLHSLYLYCTDPAFRAAYLKASLVYIDGMPIIWCGQFAGLPLMPKHRITFLESFHAILSEAEKQGWRIFYVGSQQQALNTGLSLIRNKYPRLAIDGHHGFFEKTGGQSDAVIARIHTFQPDLLFVGMGMPTQELWVAANLTYLRATAIFTSGATMDYVHGNAYQPPAWAGSLGLYGVFRLFSDPFRLWRRYLIEPLTLVRHLAIPILRQRLAQRRHAVRPTSE